MDIDRTHQALMCAANSIDAAREADKTPDVGYAFDLAEHVVCLDDRICSTGELPAKWQEPVEARLRKRLARPRTGRRPRGSANDNQLALALPLRTCA